MSLRVMKTKYYVLESRSGGQVIATGHKAQKEKPYIIDVFDPAFMTGNPLFELHDGHLRGYRPIVGVREAFDFLDDNKFSFISISV